MNRRRMQIGMWGGFDASAWERYAMPGINGLELCQLNGERELQEASFFCREQGIAFGIHAPALRNDAYVLPKLTSSDEEERAAALRHMEEQLALAKEFGAEYVLAHFPYPAHLPAKRWEPVARLLPTPDVYETHPPQEERLFADIGNRVFDSLSELQRRYEQRIVLEYDFFGDYENIFISLFAEYNEIEAVLDTQRLDVHAKAFPGFDPYRFIDGIAPYAYLVHHSNVFFEEDGMKRHLPVLPEQGEDSRFGDAAAYLERISRWNDRFHLLFEHQASRVTIEQLAACYRTAAQTIGLYR